jgi:hypothetical protein
MGQVGELSFTVQVTRKDGQVEEHQLVGRINVEQAEALGIPPTDPETTPKD